MADVFPMIGEEWSTFVADIAAQGVVNPIVWSADGETLIDGRNRLRAWLELGNDVASCPSRRLAAGEDEFAFIVSANVARRSMNKGQLAMAAARAFPIYQERGRARFAAWIAQRKEGNAGPLAGGALDARDEAGQAFRVGAKTVDRARKLLAAESTDMTGRVSALISLVERGELAVTVAAAQLDLLNFTPSKLDEPMPTGKFDAALKAVKDFDSATTAELIRLLAGKIGMSVALTPKD
jgi:hypothetical protein